MSKYKMEDIRVYVANSDSWYKNLDGESDLDDVMDCAEAQGTVYTLPNFVRAFNNGEVDLSGGNTVLRIAEFDGYEFQIGV